MLKKTIDIINAPIPQEIIKTRSSAGKELSYITGSTVTDILNKAFGFEWDWIIEKSFIQESVPKKIKSTGKFEEQGPVAHVFGKLIVPVFNEDGTVKRYITKSGAGSKSVIGGQSEQESIFKAASTDGLKKAASLLGIGLELYRDEDEQNFFYEMYVEEVWSPEMMQKYEKERAVIKSIKEKHGLDPEQMDDIFSNFSEGKMPSISYLSPENIVAFSKYMEELDANNESGE